jgi:hypothetical protein
MILFVPYPFSLFSFLHVDIHQAVEQQYLIDPVMGDVNPVDFFDLLLQMDGTQHVGMVGFEDYALGFGIDWLRSSPGRF